MRFTFENNTYIVIVDKEVYGLDVLHKCFYWYTGDFDLDISNDGEKQFVITLESKNELQDYDLLKAKIKRDLIDFKLRDIITKDTQTIRELIVAKAFANYEDSYDEPIGHVSDPVGFDPRLIK